MEHTSNHNQFFYYSMICTDDFAFWLAENTSPIFKQCIKSHSFALFADFFLRFEENHANLKQKLWNYMVTYFVLEQIILLFNHGRMKDFNTKNQV